MVLTLRSSSVLACASGRLASARRLFASPTQSFQSSRERSVAADQFLCCCSSPKPLLIAMPAYCSCLISMPPMPPMPLCIPHEISVTTQVERDAPRLSTEELRSKRNLRMPTGSRFGYASYVAAASTALLGRPLPQRCITVATVASGRTVDLMWSQRASALMLCLHCRFGGCTPCRPGTFRSSTPTMLAPCHLPPPPRAAGTFLYFVLVLCRVKRALVRRDA